MISRLIGDESLEAYHAQAIDTHRILDAIQESLQESARISLDRSSNQL